MVYFFISGTTPHEIKIAPHGDTISQIEQVATIGS